MVRVGWCFRTGSISPLPEIPVLEIPEFEIPVFEIPVFVSVRSQRRVHDRPLDSVSRMVVAMLPHRTGLLQQT